MHPVKLVMPPKTFRPMKAPNTDLLTFDELEELPKDDFLASKKLDGIRMIINNGKILSNSGKEVPNKYLYKYFDKLIQVSLQKPSIYFDGEFYSHKLTFGEIFSYWSTHNLEFLAISMSEFVPELKFHIFDAFFAEEPDLPYWFRLKNLQDIYIVENLLMSNSEVMKQKTITSLLSEAPHLGIEPTIKAACNRVLDHGYEGLMFKHKDSKYKTNRATRKENTFHKVKRMETFDGVIIGVTQAKVVDPDAESKINELGYTETSKKKDDRIAIDSAAAFVVMYKGKEVKPSLSTLTHKEREEIWKIKDNLIGLTIEYEGMLTGAKDVPRHPRFIRVREPK